MTKLHARENVMCYSANFSYLWAILFVLFIPLVGYANPIGISSDASNTPQNPPPADYIHYVQAKNIKPAQPHVVLTKECQLATDFISSTSIIGDEQYTTCPQGFLPYQMKAKGIAVGGIGGRSYKLYCCKGDISYS
jgi:hypothetical protein